MAGFVLSGGDLVAQQQVTPSKQEYIVVDQATTIQPKGDQIKLVAAVALLLAGAVGYYMLTKQGPWVQWAVLLGAVVAAVVLFFFSGTGQRFTAFAKDAWREVQKVVWPERKEAIQVTLYVFAFVVVMALFLWSVDKLLEWTIFDLILNWRK